MRWCKLPVHVHLDSPIGVSPVRRGVGSGVNSTHPGSAPVHKRNFKDLPGPPAMPEITWQSGSWLRGRGSERATAQTAQKRLCSRGDTGGLCQEYERARILDSFLVVGAIVTLTGRTNVELNGKGAKVLGWDSGNSRYELRIDGKTETQLINPKNCISEDWTY